MTTSDQKWMLDRDSGVTLWRQIADTMRYNLSILADESGRLPSEPQLANLFDVNRLTIRAAVKALIDEGLVRREQGRGTFCQKVKRLQYPITIRTRFSEALADQTEEQHTQFMGHAVEQATPQLAAALCLEQDKLVRVKLISFADDVPIVSSTSWFPKDRFATIATAIQNTGSITKALQEHGVTDYVRLSTKIDAQSATPKDIKDLKLSPGSIVLVTEAVNTDVKGRPIQFSQSRFAADRISLTIDNS